MPMSCNRINHEAQPSYENTSESSSCTFSLSSPQQVVWLDQILHPDNTCYNIGSVVFVEGELDETLLIRAFKSVVARHDALRLRLVHNQELPQQKLVDALPVSISVHDLSGHSNPIEQAEQYLHSAFVRPFDLNDELWRFELLRIGNNRWYWQFCCHHLIGDGTTLGLISEEIASIYSKLARGEEMTESVPSYLDFVDEDTAYLSSKRYLQDRQFWLERYESVPPALLQPSNSDKTKESRHPEPVIYQFDKTLFQRIEELVASQELSVLHFMYAVLACYFFRTTHFSRTDSSEEIVFGIPVHNRKNIKQKRMVGMFTSVIPVGITVTPQDSFLDVMKKAATELRRCYKRQRLPIAELNRHLQARQKSGHVQLFDIMLSYEKIELNASLPAALLTCSKIQRGAPFPLIVAVHQYAFTTNNEDVGKPVTLEFDYSPDYLNHAEAVALQSRLVALTEAAIASPDTAIRHLPILSQTEQQQVLADFNATQMNFPKSTLIHQLVEIQAEQYPDAVAVEFGEQTLSYDELNRRANRLANYLVTLGVKPDERVAICVERSPEMIVGLLAILKAGGTYIPLDPSYPMERLAYMLRDSEPVVLLTQVALSEELERAIPAVGYTTVLLDSQQSYLAEHPEYNPDPQALGLTPQHPGYVIYTSGSTGLPKGVEMPLSSLSNLLQWHAYSPSRLSRTGKTLQFSAFGFDVAFQEIFTTLSEGGCLVLISEAMRREPQQFLQLIQQKQVNRIFLPYVALQHLAEAAGSSKDDFSCLTHIITAGEQLRITPAIQHLVQRAGCQLHNHYGPTESHVVTTYTLDKETEHWPVLPPIGQPIANARIYILDEYGQPVPSGVTGEIHIAGRSVARGYLNRPELTAERFLIDPFSTEPDAHMYKTGDLGRWLPDGNIEYLGRNDFQIKLRGFRVEPGEIEAQLMLCHGVREAVVIAREDVFDEKTGGQKRLVAYLRPQEGVRLEPAELRQQLVPHLAEYMLPSAFVTLDAFPLTPNGKLDRNALPAPDLSAMATHPYVEPVDKTEIVLAQIWQSLFGLERVGRHDHFFELGGDSLLAVQLSARIRRIMGRELPLQQIFTRPALMELAQVISEAAVSTQTVIPSTDRSQPLPLSFAQQRLWFLNQLDPAASRAYHIPVALRLTGQLNHHALTSTLNHLVARHESLRTRFILVEGQPYQHIDPADTGFTLSYHELRNLDPAQRAERIEKITALEALTTFDFIHGPLVRGHLLQLTDEEHLLLITLHHIITDGWSIGVFMRELDIIYHALLNGHDVSLSPLSIQYADYAVWQREWLQKNIFTAQQNFWRIQLENAPVLLSLPTDRPRPAIQSYIGSQAPFQLDNTVLASLQALGKRHDTTLFMTLLAGWSIVLSRLSGQDDVVIGTPIANRSLSELEGLMGFFVNTLALRIRLNNHVSVADLLAQVREQALAAYAHQDLPFEQVVEALQPERSLSYSPIFQVMLALDNTPVQDQTSHELQITRLEQAGHSAHFDLMLLLTESDRGLTGGLEYAVDLFDATTAERMVGYLINVLTAMAEDETQAITHLPMLSTAERQRLLVDFNATQDTFPDINRPQSALIHELFEQQVTQTPADIAVVFEQQTLSYDALNRHANQLAHYLVKLGIKPDDRIAICVERCTEMIVGLLAILKAGGAYVPLDPAYPAERLAYMLEDSAPTAILTQTTLADTLLSAVPIVLLDNILDISSSTLAELPDHNLDAQALGLTSHHLAYIIYTSGSTGLPKGVAVEHRNTVNLLNWAQTTFSPQALAHTLFATSLNFDLSVYECFTPLISGGTVHVVPDVLSLINTRSIATKQNISLINTVPSAIPQLIEANAIPASILTVNLAGEALKPHVVKLLFTHTNIRHICNLYGPSETTTYSTWTRIDRTTGFHNHIGRPIANTRIYILEPSGQPAPLGTVGEIHIAGAGVARGYLNRPELTMERFPADPFSSEPDARMYKTGDLGRWLPDGNIEYIGRNDFQVKIRGFRIELGEIEAQLIQCDGVREAVVIAREETFNKLAIEEKTGEQKRLIAYLRPQEGVELSPSELRQQLAQHLAEYMLPSAFVVLENFPLTPNGKLDRQALPEPDASTVITRSYQAPIGEKETTLAHIWQELLGLEQVSRHDHFFELGGHSLMMVSLIERLYKFGWKLDVRSVFSAPVLMVMAQAIQGDADTFVVPPNLIPDDCTAITPDMLPLVSLSQAEIDAIVEVTPGGASNIQDIYPLAPLQEGILFHHLLQEQDDIYLLHCMLTFNTRAYLDDFLSGFQYVIDRHDILRTAACWQGLVKPVQVVWRQARLTINEFIPSTTDDIPAQLRALNNPREHRLKLNHAPLFLVDIAYDPVQDNWLLALHFHHMIADHMTLELIFDEIALIQPIQKQLAQKQQGQTETLPAAVPYRNFIAQTLSVPPAVHEAYFREQLADIDTPTAPFGVLSLTDDEPVAEAHLSFDPVLAENIRKQARRLGVNPGVLFHVAWAQVLAQTSGGHDVVFGSVLLGRLQGGKGTARTLGMFINTLPVRVSLTGQSVLDTVQATYRNLTTLLEHEQAPLALAQQCSGVAQPMPLLSTLLNYRHTRLNEDDIFEMPQLGMRILAVEERTNYPITLSVDDTGAGFRLTALAGAGIDPARITTYLETALRGLTDALARNPQQPIQGLSILPATERQQLLVDFNTAQTTLSPTEDAQPGLIHQSFEEQAAHHPDAIAITFEGNAFSYGELNRRANQLAHYLIAQGVRPDDRVAICTERSPLLIIGLLAILKAGGAYLPLDPAYPAERLRYMLEDAAPVAILTHSVHADKLAENHIPTVLLDAQEACLTTQQMDNPAVHLTTHNLAYVIYTSGSTGQPKGVMVEHRSVLRLIINSGFADIGPDDRVAHCANIAFDASTWEIWSALLNGGCLHIIPQTVLLDPVRFSHSLIEGKVTALWLTVGLFNAYLDVLMPMFGQLRYLLVGGDVLDPAKSRQVLSSESHPAQLINCYGPTETTTFATTYAITSLADATHSVPIGGPIANTQIYILDPNGLPVPVGVAGEIYIAGTGVARGYLNLPELTAERFLADPFSSEPDARMYKTGDLGRWLADGNIEYLGRNDFQVKIRGFRIELGEIEAQLMQCNSVREAVVIAREDGSKQKQLVAYLQPHNGQSLIPAELRQQLSQHLADYMLPSAFVMLETFPLTPNGKLDRQALPAPDLAAVVTRGYEAPINEIETALAQIWQKLLGVQQVGRYDHFFELGGHSLLAVQFVAYVRQELAKTLSLKQLFDQPILADLAQLITETATARQIEIPIADRNQPLPLSFAQQRLWFLTQIDQAASLAYHIPVALRLSGQLSHHALSQALNNLVARQESLRTRFISVAGHPCQYIDQADTSFTLSHHDLRQLTPEERTDRITELTTLETQTPFDFTQEPLVRGHLLQLADEEHIFLLTQHHIIADGWSVGVLMRELSILYRAALENQENPLLPLPIQYADYAVWQRGWLQGSALTAQSDFWFSRLKDAPALLTLPTNRPRPTVQSFVGGRVPVYFDAELLASLKKLGQRHNSTLFMTLLAAWSIVLARLSGQDDIVIGTPVANRPHQTLEGLIGFFVNTLALRTRISDSDSVTELLTQIREQMLDDYANQDLPFEQVVEALQPERDLSYSPVFQVMLALNNTPAQALNLPDIHCTPVEQIHPSAHFDLTLSLTENESGLAGELTYAADLFDSATIERMTGYLVNVLTAMVTDDTQCIATLPMLPASERHQLLVDFNAIQIGSTQSGFPQNALIHQLVEAQVLQRPDAIAVVYENQTLSYHELNQRANQLAHHLLALGVRPDDRVALCAERSPEMVIGLLATLKAGGAYVPLDPAYPAERLNFMLEDAAPVVLLTTTELANQLASTLPTVLLNHPEQFTTTQRTDSPDAQVLGLTPRHLAYVIYTSGSTGQPKGVMIEHHSLCNLVTTQQNALALTPESRVLQFASGSFDASVWECAMALLTGASLYLAKRADLLPGAILSDYLETHAISHVLLSPTALAAMDSLPDTLQTLLVGGEACPPGLVKRWSAGRQMLNAYGPTEITVCATLYPCDSQENTPPPIGRPITNTQIYILDANTQPVPVGVTGEIYIAGSGVARGYLNRPELTAERFLNDPFSSEPNARMYKTGDLGRWRSDGNIEYLGRNDFQVKLRGFRIELREIEARLVQCSGIREAVVLMREDEPDQKRLVAYLKPEEGTELVPAELRQQLAQHLAEYMLPGAFVMLDSFPLTPNGKLDRQALPAPDLSALAIQGYKAPVGEAEVTLAQIWQQLLGLEQVSRYDNFFALGGHSLLIVSLIAELHNHGWQLDVRSVFAAPVLADMAQAAQRDAEVFVVPPNLIPDGCQAITPDMLPLVSLSQSDIDAITAHVSGGAGNVQDIYPLAPLQEGILFHHLLQTQGDDYLLHTLIAFDTRTHLDSFLSAMQQVIDRHDILRTSVYWQDLVQPVQVVWRQAALCIKEFTPETEDDISAQLRTHTDPRWHRIDLTHAPLFTADIAHDTVQNEWLLALRFHHLVSDHMTLDLIFAEIARIRQGNADTLPVSVPYRNFIAQTLNVPVSVHEDYFREQLADIDEPTAPFNVLKMPKNSALPDHPQLRDNSNSVAKSRILLDNDLANAIRSQARRLGVTPGVLFHVAWAQVLAHTSGRDDVVFGSVLLGRLQGITGAEQILGMFVNTLPIRISLADRRVQETVLDTYHRLTALLEHEQAPLTLAQQCSGVAQPMPLFGALLNYRHSQMTQTEMDTLWADMRVVAAEERTNYPITLSVDDLGDGFQLTALTVTDISPDQVTSYLITAINGLIKALIDQPQQPILDIPILSGSERQRLLVEFNSAETQSVFPENMLIHQLIEIQALQRPDAIAVTDENQSLSYRELNQRANRLAYHLLTLGIRPDDRVAICIERSPEMVIGLLAILKAGGAYLPLDPHYPAERLSFMLEDAAPVALLTRSQWHEKLNSTLPVILLDDESDSAASFPIHNPDIQASGLTSRHLAYVIYTSGSTGQPKGVMVEHRNVVSLLINNGFADIGPDDCIAHCANVSFDAATWEVWAALAQGARILLIPEKTLLQPDQFGHALSSEKVSALFLTTALFNQYAGLIAPALSGLRYLLFGGEQTDTRTAIRFRTDYPPQHLLHVYGPTETTTFASAYEIPLMAEQADAGEIKIPIGRPIANRQIYILDKQGHPVPVGVSGEIYIAGAGVARGYLNRPELTMERFLLDPFSSKPNARMYKTGDLGRWRADGNIEYLGRNDFQIKLRGFRIELGEIEARLVQCHGVREAVVLIREDEPDQKRLVAYLRPEEGSELVPAELRRQLTQHLADYMLPSAFVMLDSFPLTPNGKLDRQALPVPDASAVITREYEAPVGDIEIALSRIWQDLLGLERVGRHDHFFELGGHSLLAVQLTARIRQVLARELALQQLFDQPRLMELAQVLTDVATTTQMTIPPADRNQPLPLSFAQQRLWFLDRLDPAASLAYHIPLALRLTGQLNHHALRQTFDNLVARHEILRTRFVLVAGQPHQQITTADSRFALVYQDLRTLTADEQTQRVTELATTETRIPFDFTQGSLIRGQLLQLADDEHVLLITQHHIISDGWSVGVLMRELSVLYRAALENQANPLLPLPIQYADYAVWQRDNLHEATLNKQREFWCHQLRDAPALLTLPTDRPRPASQTFTGGRVPVHFNAKLLASLKTLGQRHNSTLFMTLLTAWSIVLARLSGQDDIVIGTPVANRQHRELEGLIGFFVNTLALRVRLNDSVSVVDLFRQIREQTLAAYANQDLPFEQVVEALQPERSLSYSPIFQVMLALNNTPAQALTLPDLQFTVMEPIHHSAHFDLTLSLTETDAGLTGELTYASALFDAATIERMLGYLTNILNAMVSDESQLAATVPMLSQSERQQLLMGFNAHQADCPQNVLPDNVLLHQLFEAQAEQNPDAIAVVFEGQTLSYDELNQRANYLAHQLITQGVRPDDRVAICVERSLEMVVGLLAILKAGGAYIPLDPAYPAERLAYMLADSDPVVIVTQTTLAEKLTSTLPVVMLDVVMLDIVMLDDLLSGDLLPDQAQFKNPDVQKSALKPHHLAYIIYTSGSTGKPKGVMVEHANVTRLLAATQARFRFDSHDVWTLFHSFAFDFSVWELWGALAYGGKLVVIPAECARSPQMFYERLCREQVTILNQTPSAFRQLIAAQNMASHDLPPHMLRCIIFGGEALELHTLAPWVERNPTKQTRLVNMYGITEITVHATYRELTEADIHARRGSLIGQPLDDLRIYILDAYGQPVPLGVTGELYIAGAGVARGYLNRPELTAGRFLSDPFSGKPDTRMYKTGDLGRWLPDGNIEYLGRNDFQVKIRGFRIELGEIEARLEQCAGVREAVVIAREDGTHQKQLVAYLLPQPDAILNPTELRQQLAQHLADYMLPSAFVTLDAFPLTANGKLDQRALPAPDSSAVVSHRYVSPVGETETALAHIWQRLLKLERVGRHDHFFELGGHSLMIVGLIEELRLIGWQLDVRSVFISPVLADMAQALQRDTDEIFIAPVNGIPENCQLITPDMLPLVALSQTEIDAIVATVPGGAANVQDIYPLSPLQEGILFHHLLQTQGDNYLLQSLLAFDSRERLEAFLSALQQVIDRHDILRTAAYWQDLANPVQIVWRQASLSVNVFTPATEIDIVTQLREHTDPRRYRIDLNRAPLFTADIVHDPEHNEWLMALRFHHLVSDHMTLELIFAEIALFLTGNTKILPAVLPYRNFIARTLHMPESEHEAYFRSRLADIDEPTAPFGILKVQTDGERVAESCLAIAPELAAAIRAQARYLGVSPSVLFHVAWAQVLAKTSGRDDVVFGSVLLGRLQGGAGAEQVLGMFINTLPMRVSVGDCTVQEAIQDTFHNLMLLLEHEQAPLVLAQQCSGVPQSMPLFSTLLNYRHSQTAESVDTVWTGIRILTAEERTNYPITLSVDDLGTGFRLISQTITGIDPDRITAYLVTAINGLIDALTHNPQHLLRDISILPATERKQLLTDFNANQVEFPNNILIHTLFEEQSARAPDATAIIFAEQTLSYHELNCRANQLAHYLIKQGVQPDDRIAVCLERSPALIISLLAILKAGGGYVPLDPTYPTERLAYMLEDSSPVVLLTQAAQAEKLFHSASMISVPIVELDTQAPLLAEQPAHNPDVQALGLMPHHLAYVIYTSGSTGLPKGVMVEHRNVLRLIIDNGFADIRPDDCVAHCANTAFDASTWEIWSALLNGGRLHIVSQSVLLEPAQFCDSLIKAQVTALWLTAGLFNEYLDTLRPLFGQLRYLIVGGDVLDPQRIQEVILSDPQPAALINGYGPTETTTFAATYTIASPVDVTRSIPIGRPISNTQIYILDEYGQLAPFGAVGEIYIAGQGVARGYLNRPELTQERFLTCPFSSEPDARMYRTGDLGRWLPDGNIEYLGRNDTQIKLRGFRIEPGEIEIRLEQCYGVREAVVLLREDEPENKRLVAYLLPQSGIELDPAVLRHQLAEHLAEYMLPSAYVVLSAFPLTPNGKLDRRALPAPELSAVVTHEYEAPQGRIETALAQIWQELLGLTRISRHDSFFELGGHSLMVVRLITRIKNQFMVNVPLTSLFVSPKLMEQADLIFAAQMSAIGDNDTESIQSDLDAMSAEELMAILGENDTREKDTGGDSK
ncbi:non-ribosomal peptide synthetase [Xenorhabdus bharatensis]|uniref:non-ribosomal peptide synthetase n=1 Tax=Xenorhabdus bharatensis TaxID=3136256 RepID=UPI0030F3F3F7